MRYQLPGQFSGNAPGTTVNYGGTNYVVNADGTMSPAAAAAQPSVAQPAAAQPAANGARFQLPAQFSATQPGTIVNYGGTAYLVNADGTMSPTAAVVPAPPGGIGNPMAPGTDRRAMYAQPGAPRPQPVYASPQSPPPPE
jgi:hypothetical protein